MRQVCYEKACGNEFMKKTSVKMVSQKILRIKFTDGRISSLKNVLKKHWIKLFSNIQNG